MNKTETFSNELNLIDNQELRKFAGECLERAPDYFFTMPASTTGKYHPAYTLGDGGLVRHTQAAVKIANDLLNLEMYRKIKERRDEIIVALILHDSVKKGMNGSAYTTVDHPLQASALVKKVHEETPFSSPEDNGRVRFICNLIETHMGQWTSDRGREVLEKPQTIEQKFVHMCDYLASRKYLTVNLTEEF